MHCDVKRTNLLQNAAKFLAHCIKEFYYKMSDNYKMWCHYIVKLKFISSLPKLGYYILWNGPYFLCQVQIPSTCFYISAKRSLSTEEVSLRFGLSYPGRDHDQDGTENRAQQVPQTFTVQLHRHCNQQSPEHEQSLGDDNMKLISEQG